MRSSCAIKHPFFYFIIIVFLRLSHSSVQNLLLLSALALNLRAKSYTKIHFTTGRRVERKGVSEGGKKHSEFKNSPSKANIYNLTAGKRKYSKLLLTEDIDDI